MIIVIIINVVFTSNPIVSSKQKLSGLETANKLLSVVNDHVFKINDLVLCVLF